MSNQETPTNEQRPQTPTQPPQATKNTPPNSQSRQRQRSPPKVVNPVTYIAEKLSACDQRIEDLSRTIAELEKQEKEAAAQKKKQHQQMMAASTKSFKSSSVSGSVPRGLDGSVTSTGKIEHVYGGKAISPEECETMVNRLTRARPKSPELPPIPGFVRKEIDGEQVEGLVSRLGAVDVETRRAKIDDAMQRELDNYPLTVITREKEEKGKTSKLTPDQVQDMGLRLSEGSMEKKKKNMEKVRAEILQPLTDYQKSITAETKNALLDRIYGNSVEHSAKVKKETHAMYVVDLFPKKKISQATLKAAADRLSRPFSRGPAS